MVGAVAGMGRAAFATPAALERAMIVGTEAAKKEMPQVAKMVASNAVLFSSVGFAYAGGKCLCEGLYGEPHPLNSGWELECIPIARRARRCLPCG